MISQHLVQPQQLEKRCEDADYDGAERLVCCSHEGDEEMMIYNDGGNDSLEKKEEEADGDNETENRWKGDGSAVVCFSARMNNGDDVGYHQEL